MARKSKTLYNDDHFMVMTKDHFFVRRQEVGSDHFFQVKDSMLHYTVSAWLSETDAQEECCKLNKEANWCTPSC